MGLSIEEAAKLGFHLVEEIEGELAKFERVTASGTHVIKASSVEKALEDIEYLLGAHPGSPGSGVSARSDGGLELRDDLAAQSAAAGTAGPQPGAAIEAAKAPEAAVDTSGLIDTSSATSEVAPAAEPAVEVATGIVDVPAEPAAEAAPEGTVES